MRTSLLSLSAVLLLSASTPAFAASLCIVDSPGGNNITVDCDFANPTPWPNATIGYSIDGPPCQEGSCGFLPRGGQPYGWSISASSVDPLVNSGPLPIPIAELYLWMYCTTLDGAAAAEFSLQTDDPGFLLLGLNPAGPVLNAGTAVDPLLAIGGCPDGPVLVATLVLLNLGPVPVEEQTWGGIKALYR